MAAVHYDLIFPSPISLENISAIVEAKELWRLNLKTHREKNTLHSFCSVPGKPCYESSDRHVKNNFDLDRFAGEQFWTVKPKVERYLTELVLSIGNWLDINFEYIFRVGRKKKHDIWMDFDDIVCDWDGSIHYVRTAERMLRCDRVSQNEKFMIACAYSFEDTIKEMWPSVKNDFEKPYVDFKYCPHLYYWIHRLENTMEDIPNGSGVLNDDFIMLRNTEIEYRSSFDYFWNRVSLESQYKIFLQIYRTIRPDGYRVITSNWNNDEGRSFKYSHEKTRRFFYRPIDKVYKFCSRFLLPKLSQEHLIEFVSAEGENFIFLVWITCDEIHTLSAWMYIKDYIDTKNFASLIRKRILENRRLNDEKIETFCKILTSAPEHLKNSAIGEILSSRGLFDRVRPTEMYSYSMPLGASLNPTKPRDIKILTTVLMEGTLQQRNYFWCMNWSSLLTTTRLADLQQIIQLCFSNETEIEQFKNTTMARYKNLTKIASEFFTLGCFKELSNLVDFCCPDEHARRNLKKRILQSFFVDQGRLEGVISPQDNINISEPNLLHEFINDAYSGDVDGAMHFRNQLISSPATEHRLALCIQGGKLIQVKQFVESFESTGLDVQELKESFVYIFRKCLLEGNFWQMDVHDFQQFLLWCLGSDDQVIRFKQSIDPDAVCGTITDPLEMYLDNEAVMQYYDAYDNFQLWYSNPTLLKMHSS